MPDANCTEVDHKRQHAMEMLRRMDLSKCQDISVLMTVYEEKAVRTFELCGRKPTPPQPSHALESGTTTRGG